MPISVDLAVLAVCLIFGAWLLLTVLVNLPDETVKQRIRSADLAGLIPEWSLFAPIPGTSDLIVLYRDRMVDGSLTEFEIVPFYGPRQWHHVIWHPARRQWKALEQIASSLDDAIYRLPDHELFATIPYLMLLNHITHRPHAPTAEACQFSIVTMKETPAGVKVDLVLLSRFHQLPPLHADPR